MASSAAWDVESGRPSRSSPANREQSNGLNIGLKAPQTIGMNQRAGANDVESLYTKAAPRGESRGDRSANRDQRVLRWRLPVRAVGPAGHSVPNLFWISVANLPLSRILPPLQGQGGAPAPNSPIPILSFPLKGKGR